MIYPKTLKNKKYPEFIRNNSTIKKYPSPEKKFDASGFPDFSKPYTHKCNFSLTTIVSSLKELLKKVSILYKNEYHYDCDRISSIHQKKYLSNKEEASNKIDGLIEKITISSIKSKKGSKLIMPVSITIWNSDRFRKNTYKKGSSITLLITDLYDEISEIYTTALKNDLNDLWILINQLMEFELSLIKTLKIVFSTHPWDIATMSMRGIKSCQAWGKLQSPCLVGSIVDPNLGIVYLTDGKAHKKYGERMLARSVVRLTMPVWTIGTNYSYVPVSAEEKRLRYLYIEGAYTNFGHGGGRKIISDLFYTALSTKAMKSPLFLRIENKPKYICQIPLSPAVKRLREGNRSYRDSSLGYTNEVI